MGTSQSTRSGRPTKGRPANRSPRSSEPPAPSTPTSTATVEVSALGPTTERTPKDQTPLPVPAPGKGKKDPLLSGICHDLRAPLAAVTMGANFVLQTTPETEESGRARRVLQAILRSCKQMERLVRDFADLSEIEADAVELRTCVHDASEMVEIAAEAAKANAAARNVSIDVERPAEPLPLRCDHDRLIRAINHVVDNAIRFTPDNGKIFLSVKDDGGEARFTVRDLGPGLSDETMAHLYERSWHSKKADRVGAGLGLAIVRGILQAHHGRVAVSSKPGLTTVDLIVPKEGVSADEISATPSRH